MSFVLPWCVLVVAQGGFYAPATLAVGVVIAVVAGVFCRHGARLSRLSLLVPICIMVSGVACCLSAILHGEFASMLLGCVWSMAAAPALLAAVLDPVGRERALACLEKAAVCGSVLGVLMFAGIVPWPGAVHADRLQFFVQYANTAGIMFAVLFLATARLPATRWSLGRPLLVMTMGLTASVGATASFLVGVIMLSLLTRQSDHASRTFLVVDTALGVAGAFLAFADSAAFACVGAVLVTGIRVAVDRVVPLRRWVTMGIRRDTACKKAQTVAMCCAVLGIVAVLIALVLCLGYFVGAFGRLAQAAGTFLERLDQIEDAFFLLMTSPFVGVGPGAWDGLYQQIQTTDYVSSVVHSSFAQLALDGGLLALLPFCAACVFGFTGLVRKEDWGVATGTFVLLLHALFDFDLCFGAVLYLLAFMLGFGADGLCHQASDRSPHPEVSRLRGRQDR